MGQRTNHTCSACKYEAIVSGGRDVGFFIVTQTCLCSNCHEVMDVCLGEHGGHPRSVQTEVTVLDCPECGSKTLTPWSSEHPICPKCGDQMSDRDSNIIMMWD